MIVDDRLRTAERHPAPAGSLPAPVPGDIPRQLTKNRPAVTPAAPPVGGTQASIAIDRWVNEGGRIYLGDRTVSRAAGHARPASPAVTGAARPHVMIAGAGVAGLETVLATRALTGDRLDRVSAAVQPHRDPRQPARDATSRLQRWSAPDALGVRHLAPYGHGPCGDILRCSPHAIDIMREHDAPGSWRQCLDLLDPAVC